MAVELAALLEANNLVLFALLILVFVLAYKIMQTVIQVSIVSILSALFFAAVTYLGIGPPFSVSNLLLFAVLGPALYLAYLIVFQFTDLFLTFAGFGRKLTDLTVSLLRKLAGLFTTENSGSSKGSGAAKNTGSGDTNGESEKKIILDELGD